MLGTTYRILIKAIIVIGHSDGLAGSLCSLSKRKVSNNVSNNDGENAI
jgi:hypothetical protein